MSWRQACLSALHDCRKMLPLKRFAWYRAREGEIVLLRAALAGRGISLRNTKAELTSAQSSLKNKDAELQVALSCQGSYWLCKGKHPSRDAYYMCWAHYALTAGSGAIVQCHLCDISIVVSDKASFSMVV